MYDPKLKQNFESPTRLSLIQVTDFSMRQTPLAYFRILNKTKCIPINIIMTVKKKKKKNIEISSHHRSSTVNSCKLICHIGTLERSFLYSILPQYLFINSPQSIYAKHDGKKNNTSHLQERYTLHLLRGANLQAKKHPYRKPKLVLQK